MLQTIAIVLLILWLLGLATSYPIGGFIHSLRVVAMMASTSRMWMKPPMV